MADIDAYKDKFSESGRRVLETALDESKKRDQNYVAIEHILHVALVGRNTVASNLPSPS